MLNLISVTQLDHPDSTTQAAIDDGLRRILDRSHANKIVLSREHTKARRKKTFKDAAIAKRETDLHDPIIFDPSGARVDKNPKTSHVHENAEVTDWWPVAPTHFNSDCYELEQIVKDPDAPNEYGTNLPLHGVQVNPTTYSPVCGISSSSPLPCEVLQFYDRASIYHAGDVVRANTAPRKPVLTYESAFARKINPRPGPKLKFDKDEYGSWRVATLSGSNVKIVNRKIDELELKQNLLLNPKKKHKSASRTRQLLKESANAAYKPQDKADIARFGIRGKAGVKGYKPANGWPKPPSSASPVTKINTQYRHDPLSDSNESNLSELFEPDYASDDSYEARMAAISPFELDGSPLFRYNVDFPPLHLNDPAEGLDAIPDHYPLGYDPLIPALTPVSAFVASIDDSNYDTRKYPVCPPFDGSKGLKFMRWSDRFLSAIATVDTKDPNEMFDLSDCLVGIDEGGDIAPPGNNLPIPLGGAAAQRRRTKRLKLSYAHVYRHIDNESLRRMLASEAIGDGRRAWQVLVRECFEPITELELEDLKRNVRDLTIISTVGYHAHSLSMFRRVMNDENTKIPNFNDQISEHELAINMLAAIAKAAPNLAAAADIELKSAQPNRVLVYPAGHPNAGSRSLSAIVAHFEPLWKAAIQRGTIPIRAATKVARVDGMRVAVEADDDSEFAPNGDDALPPGEILACVARSIAKQEDGISGEIISWNCKGVGHPKSKCPSSRRERTYSNVISALSHLSTKQQPAAGNPRPGGKAPVRFTPRTGARTPSRQRPRPGKSNISAYLMDDGTFAVPDADEEHTEWNEADAPGGSGEPSPEDEGAHDPAYANLLSIMGDSLEYDEPESATDPE